ncbi:unnamed protein product [Rhodiola kirilowii]
MWTREVVVAAVTGVATVVAVAAVLRQWRRRSEKRRRMTLSILTSFTRECSTPVQKLWLIADALVSEMQSALGGADVDKSASKGVKLAVSYVSPLPTGVEEGLYYGVNLRGTDYLMLRARLGGKDQCISDLQRQEVSMPSNLLNAPAEELFEHIAWNLAKFSAVQGPNADTTALVKGKLGFTISHPVDQNLSPVAAVNWRHFSPNDPAGKELVDHFNKALEKHGLDLQVDSLVDETTGDLAGGRYCSKDAIAAVTLGMHTNVAYVQSAQQTVPISIWDGPMPRSGEMVMNMDWGSFVSSHLPIGKPDAELDAESFDPACRAFEKLISGMYLGEIVRRVLLKMAQETALFGDCVPEKLHVPDLLRSPDMAAMHQDTSEDRQVVNEKLQEIFGISNSSPFAREVVADVCDIVAERAARLAGAGVVAIVKKLDRIKNKRSVVIVEGGLYEHYRVFRNYVHCSIWEMLGREVADNVVIEHSLGGSGAGALFMAAASQPADDTSSS